MKEELLAHATNGGTPRAQERAQTTTGNLPRVAVHNPRLITQNPPRCQCCAALASQLPDNACVSTPPDRASPARSVAFEVTSPTRCLTPFFGLRPACPLACVASAHHTRGRRRDE